MAAAREFRCPVCAGRTWRELRRIDSVLRPVPPGLTRPREIHVTIGRCRGCGLELNTDLLAGKDFASLYVEDKIYSSSSTGYAYRGDIEPKYSVGAVELLVAHGSGGELLEVGFLDAASLRAHARRGWAVTGLDLDPRAVRKAVAEGLRAAQGTLDDAPFAAGFFDAVVAIAVLEHVDDPRAFLAGAHRVLTPGGLLLLQLPNPGSLNAFVSRASRHGWDMYGEPGHIYHYRKRHLLRLLSETGFKPRRYSTSTIRIRGKMPFLPGRAPRLEAWVARSTLNHRPILSVYSAFLRLLDLLSLGDTHLLLAAKERGRDERRRLSDDG